MPEELYGESNLPYVEEQAFALGTVTAVTLLA
jgi:hypothetical protein